MEGKIYLKHYRLAVDAVGIPIVIRRSAGEATFQADEIKSGERVALQVVPAAALRKAKRAELVAEGNAARKIQHLNIPALRECDFEGDQLICVTDYFEGTTAEDWVKTKGVLPVSAVLRIAAQVVSALSTATFHGVRHRALAPGNLMLVAGQTAEGEWPLVKILNFLGVAAREKAFVSPEQARGDAIDFRSQIYSLGCTLWFLLKGAPPPGDGVGALQQASDVPAPVRRLLQPMLETDPDLRPLDPLVVQEQIQTCLTQIERRDAVANKFGFAPAAAEPAGAIIDNYPTRRSASWMPFALAALLAGAATVAALVVAQRLRWHEAVGIPIGVPESSPVTSAPVAAAPPSVPPSAEPSAEGTGPAVLTSTAVAPPEETSSPNESSETAPVALAETEGQPNAAPTEPVVAMEEKQEEIVAVNNSATAEPTPPAEGPTESPPAPVETLAAPPSPEIATPTPAVAAVEEVMKQPVQHVTKQEPPKGKPPRKKPDSVTRIIAPAATPSGNVLPPPNERIYSSSPAPTLRDPVRRRPHPIMRDSQKELPVLPALPPDE